MNVLKFHESSVEDNDFKEFFTFLKFDQSFAHVIAGMKKLAKIFKWLLFTFLHVHVSIYIVCMKVVQLP